MRRITIKHGEKRRIYPNAENCIYFHQNFGCGRKFYNERVAQIPEEQKEYFAYKDEHDGSPVGFKFHWITQKEMREKYPYMKIADGLNLSDVKNDFNKAFKNYCKGKSGKPTFKKKSDFPRTYRTDNQTINGKDTIYIHENTVKGYGYLLHLPKIDKHGGVIPIKMHKPLNGRISSVTVEYTATHEWYVAITIEETLEFPDAHDDDIIDHLLGLDDGALLRSVFGGDLGLDTYVYGSDGIAYDDPQLADYKKLEKKLHREQRKLGKKRARLLKEGRKLCDCRNYQKQRIKLARIYEKIRHKRHDFLHKLSRQLVNNHDVLAFEDLCVKGMLKNHYLARGISDAAWGTFITFCKYKAEWAGKTFVQISRWYPSTQTCSVCGAKTGPKGAKDLGVREWVCPECGAVHVRDENAAWNILFEGLRVLSETEDARWGEVLERVRAAYSNVILCDQNRWDAGVSLGRSGECRGEEEGMYIQDGDSSLGSAVADEPAASKKRVCQSSMLVASSRQTDN